MLRLTTLSFAFPAVASEQRARLSMPGNRLREGYARLRAAGQEAFLLSTCLRVEIAWPAGPEATAELLACVYEDDATPQLGATRIDEAAFTHLCRVAAGLDSPLIGEPEVLGQFRHAMSVWSQVSAPSGRFKGTLDAAIGIGRISRRLLGDAPRGSLAALAAHAATPFARVVILGGGAMAQAAVEQLDGVEVKIFTRRPGHIAGRETLPWEAAATALATNPVVISTVPGKVPPSIGDAITRALAQRDEPLLLIDLGMPPAFARPESGTAVTYLGVDELASSSITSPAAAAEESTLMRAAATWRHLSSPDRVGRVISTMVERADTVASEEARRFANKLYTADDPERVLQQLAHNVARRLLHLPISFLSSSDGGEVVDLVAEAFGVVDD